MLMDYGVTARSRQPAVGAAGNAPTDRLAARLAAFALVAAFAAPSAQAALVYDNGPPNQPAGTQMSEFQVADDFTLLLDANVTNIRFWTLQSAPSDYSGSVFWAIYGNALGSPGALVQTGVTGVAEVATGAAVALPGYSQYVLDIPVAFSLTAGTYWLGLHNGPLANIAPTEMLWAATGTVRGSEGKYLDPDFGWTGTGNFNAFVLSNAVNAVPEPGSLALAFAALLAAGFVRRKA